MVTSSMQMKSLKAKDTLYICYATAHNSYLWVCALA